jgi:uncharacterized repeat protein (TIGR03843 family)
MMQANSENDSTFGAEDCGTQPLVSFFQRASIQDCDLVPWGSNYTFAVLLEDPVNQFDETIAIYKPAAGEIPLWDFPDDTLYLREYASYLVSEALGWHFIPTTVIRDGPHGIGTVQEYIEPDTDANYFTFRDDHAADLRRIALFDIITNNADRKAGHCLRSVDDGRIWGIDHGLTFNVQPKLRTVIWEFQDEPIDANLLADLERVASDGQLMTALSRYLDPLEVRVFELRVRQMIKIGVYPQLTTRRSIPWGF